MIRIDWEYSFGNNLYHYIIARMLAESKNLDLSYVNDSRWTNVNDPSKSHAKILTDPIEYFNHLNITIPYLPVKRKNISLRNKNQLKEINKNADYILSRRNSWNFFDRDAFIKDISKIRSWFPKIKNKNNKDLVVHARLGKDFYRKNRIPEFKKIKNLLESIDYEKIYICTDSPEDEYIQNFKNMGKECIVKSKGTRNCDIQTGYFLNEVDSDLIIDDFNFIRSFDKILLTSPKSTFSFLSAALSEASTVKFDVDEAKKNNYQWFIYELFE